jgi:hypothetical protein
VGATATVFVIIVVILGIAIYRKLCNLLDGLRDLIALMRDTHKHIIGDADDLDSIMIKPSLKELITDQSFKIQNEIARIRYGLFGERSPSMDGMNILDTVVDIRDAVGSNRQIITS